MKFSDRRRAIEYIRTHPPDIHEMQVADSKAEWLFFWVGLFFFCVAAVYFSGLLVVWLAS